MCLSMLPAEMSAVWRVVTSIWDDKRRLNQSSGMRGFLIKWMHVKRMVYNVTLAIRVQRGLLVRYGCVHIFNCLLHGKMRGKIMIISI